MQAYLNGSQPRDFDLHPAAPDVVDGQGNLPDEVDVLIVGTGPAGMLLAAQLAYFPGIRTRIVEKREHALELGHADGLHPRTIEMFRAFGIDHLIAREGYQANEFTFWGQPSGSPSIVREGTAPDMPAGVSEFPHIILNQARVQDFLAERMHKFPRRLTPDYGHEVRSVQRSACGEHVDVSLLVHGPDGSETPRQIRAKYVVGCDGARSTVRTSMRVDLIGDSQNHAWGVIDALVETDFPDIRKKSSVASDAGQLLVIPREGGYLVRLYVDLGDLPADGSGGGSSTTEHDIIAAAQRILHPYTLDVKHVQWWSVYTVGQRCTDRFDDLSSETSGASGTEDPEDPAGSTETAFSSPRIFIAGDACHTHSAKAGQGMNVSMADTMNLGWKLAAVLEQRSPESLLLSYSSERQPVAAELIAFDREWAKIASGVDSTGRAITTAERQSLQAQRRRFMAGVATQYPPSMCVSTAAATTGTATGYPVGERFHSAPVIRVADAKPMQLGHVHEADGRWRMYLFADARALTDPDSHLRSLSEWLAHDEHSPIRAYTAAGADDDSVIDVRAIVQHRTGTPSIPECPQILRPVKGTLGLTDWEKVFITDAAPEHHIYHLRGIDEQHGAAVIVRPDQFVAGVYALTDTTGISTLFAGCLSRPQPPGTNERSTL